VRGEFGLINIVEFCEEWVAGGMLIRRIIISKFIWRECGTNEENIAVDLCRLETTPPTGNHSVLQKSTSGEQEGDDSERLPSEDLREVSYMVPRG
jgi:hypothetical protein